MKYLLTFENKNTGRIISRHCEGANLEEAKKNFSEIVRNIIGLKYKGDFNENFKIIKKLSSMIKSTTYE